MGQGPMLPGLTVSDPLVLIFGKHAPPTPQGFFHIFFFPSHLKVVDLTDSTLSQEIPWVSLPAKSTILIHFGYLGYHNEGVGTAPGVHLQEDP